MGERVLRVRLKVWVTVLRGRCFLVLSDAAL